MATALWTALQEQEIKKIMNQSMIVGNRVRSLSSRLRHETKVTFILLTVSIILSLSNLLIRLV